MSSLVIRIAIISACFIMTACQTLPTHNHLDAGARQHIKTVDSVLIAKQNNIGADISQDSTLAQISSIVSGSLVVPALVDIGVSSVRTISANKHAKPMREALEHHDYAWEFRKQLRHALANSNLEGVDKVAIVRQEFPGLRGLMIQESEADAILFVDMKYSFTPKFDRLYVSSHAMLFPNKPELRAFQETPDRDRNIEFSDNIYRNQFAAVIKTDIEDGSKSENAAFWAALSEEELVDLLEQAGLVLSDAMATDINLDDVASDLDLVPEGYVLNTERGQIPASQSKNITVEDNIKAAPEDGVEAEEDSLNETDPRSEIESEIDAAVPEVPIETPAETPAETEAGS